jgi:hypothetical protein
MLAIMPVARNTTPRNGDHIVIGGLINFYLENRTAWFIGLGFPFDWRGCDDGFMSMDKAQSGISRDRRPLKRQIVPAAQAAAKPPRRSLQNFSFWITVGFAALA